MPKGKKKGGGGNACFNCGDEGHISRDCPTKSSHGGGGGSRACFKCGQEGHMSRDCTGSRGRGGGGNACFNCGDEGHISRDCPTKSSRGGGGGSRACFKCGQEGHMSRDCTGSRGKGKKQNYPIGHPLYYQSAGPSRAREPRDDEFEQPFASAKPISQSPRKKEKTQVYTRTVWETASGTSEESSPVVEEAASGMPEESWPLPGSSADAGESYISEEETLMPQEGLKTSSDVESLVSELGEKLDVGKDNSCRMVITSGLPAKQPPGRLGRRIELVSNLFRINYLPNGHVYHYDVSIVECRRDRTSELSLQTPAKGVERYRCLSTKVNRKVIDEMLQRNADFQNTYAVYDGQSNMYSPSPLKIKFPYKVQVSINDDSRIPLKKEKGEEDSKPVIRDVFNVLIKEVEKRDAFGQKSKSCAINLIVLQELFKGRVRDVQDIQEAVMALETIFRHAPALKYSPIGRNFYHPKIDRRCPLSAGIEIWFGYHQSLRLGQWKVMVNLNTSATTFYSEQGLIDYVAIVLKTNKKDLARKSTWEKREIKELKSQLKNLKVEMYHNKKVAKMTNCIIDVADKNARTITFVDNEKQEVSIEQYFKKQYGIKLEYPHLPCVQVKPKSKNNYLPMEICVIPEGQHCRKELEPNDQAEMIKYTADNPERRFGKIANIRTNLANYDNDRYLKSYGINVERDPVGVSGRTIPAPSLNYANNKLQPRNGSWNIRDLKFMKGAQVQSWCLLNLAGNWCESRELNNFSNQLQRIGNASGLNLERPVSIETLDRGVKDGVLRRTLTEVSKKTKLAVVVIPNKKKETYRTVKQIAEVELGLQTQCIDSKNVNKCNPSLLGNLCLKINAKMGGVNHTLTQGEIPKIMAKPVIIIGADVSHAGVTDKSGVSVAAVAGSLDMILSRFAVTCKLQKNENVKKKSVEIIVKLKDMIKSLLMAFHRHTNKKPEKIIYYRDGVSDGHFSEVLAEELKAIRGACTELQRDYEPPITFIVVQKRHHVRFRPADSRDGVRPEGNIPPGTVVDSEVVHPLHRDFYLCSHLGLKGTSRPAHYTVLADDNDFSADELQKLSYYSCNISFRCSKSISIPVPVAYADLAAYRTRLRLGTLSEDKKEQQKNTVKILPEALTAIKLPESIEHSMYYV